MNDQFSIALGQGNAFYNQRELDKAANCFRAAIRVCPDSVDANFNLGVVLRETEQWGTEISHRTRHLKTSIIFPKSRPPIKAWAVEQFSNKRHLLERATSQLPDGRWQVQWSVTKPRLNENYIIKWEW